MYVRATKINHKAVLWDRDPAHPNGEIFVKGDGEPVEVGESPAVLRALAGGRIERVTDDGEDKVIAIAPKASSGRGGKSKATEKKADDKAPNPDPNTGTGGTGEPPAGDGTGEPPAGAGTGDGTGAGDDGTPNDDANKQGPTE